MILTTILLAVCAGVLLLPTISDLLSLTRIAGGGRRRRASRAAPARLLILVPAHNEDVLIESCLHSLAALHYPAHLLDVVVIADNCADATAQVARAAGVQCLERTDLVRRGKPWAIAWALDQLPVHAYDGVVIVDADSVVDADFAAGFAAVDELEHRAVQPYNDVSNPTENRLTRMATVFSAARARFMNGLKQRAGLNVPLGNGLCIGTAVLQTHGWQAFSICEDWELYALLTAWGVRIENAPQARIYSQEARSLQQSSSQRQRWAAGKLTVLWDRGGMILRSPRSRVRQKLDAIAELTAPGPVVHLGLVAVFAPLALWLDIPGATLVAVALLASVARPIAYTVIALGADPEPWEAVRAFSFLPFYAVWRLGIQLAALAMVGNKPWIRTSRHVQSS